MILRRHMPFHAGSCASEQLILINFGQRCGFLPASLFGCVAGAKAEGKRRELVLNKAPSLSEGIDLAFLQMTKCKQLLFSKFAQVQFANWMAQITMKSLSTNLPLLYFCLVLFQQTKRHFRISHIIYFIIFYIWKWFNYTV